MIKTLLATLFISLGISAKTQVNVPNISIDEVAYNPTGNTLRVAQNVVNGKPVSTSEWAVWNDDIYFLNDSINFHYSDSADVSTTVIPINHDFNANDVYYFSFDIGINGNISNLNYIYYYFVLNNSVRFDIAFLTSSNFSVGSNYDYVLNYRSNFNIPYDSTYYQGQPCYLWFKFVNSSTSYSDVFISNVQLYSLTYSFGSGNEPSADVFSQILDGQYYDYGSHLIELNYNPSINRVFGLYNFKDSFDFTLDDFPYIEPSDGFETIVFESNDTYLKFVPFVLNKQTYFLRSMQIGLVVGAPVLSIGVILNYYNYVAANFTYQFIVPTGNNLQDLTNMFDVRIILDIQNVKDLTNRGGQFFNAIFTHDDNYYVRSYTGYYNFNASSFASNQTFNVFGSYLFNNELYYNLTNNLNGIYTSGFYCGHWGYNYDNDGEVELIQGFYYKDYDLPVTTPQVVNGNFQFTSCKLSYDDYNTLANLGIFDYIRDTSYDNATFQDLLFGLMDSPIYMITRLLSFELFGVNLFMAFSGLLTLAIILVILRFKL